MKKGLKFFVLSFLLFAIMGVITFIEINNFEIFSKIFNFIKTPSAWFVGLSIAYATSNLIQKKIFSLFSKKIKKEKEEVESKFEVFLVTLIITSLITPFIKNMASYFFSNFFIYFHIILLQSLIILYVFFKIKNDYEVSGKYFMTSEGIALFYVLIVLYFVAK